MTISKELLDELLKGVERPENLLGDAGLMKELKIRLMHHAVVVQIEGASYRLRQHADLIPEHTRAHATITPPPPPKRRGRPLKNGGAPHLHG